MYKNAKRGLMIFRNDLRLIDNPVLSALAQQCDELLCIHIIRDDKIRTNSFNLLRELRSLTRSHRTFCI